MPRAAEHRRAAAGAGRRRAPLNATERRKSLLSHVLPSTAAPPWALRTTEHYGVQSSKTEKWARRYVRNRAVVAQQRTHAPRRTPPPAPSSKSSTNLGPNRPRQKNGRGAQWRTLFPPTVPSAPASEPPFPMIPPLSPEFQVHGTSAPGEWRPRSPPGTFTRYLYSAATRGDNLWTYVRN